MKIAASCYAQLVALGNGQAVRSRPFPKWCHSLRRLTSRDGPKCASTLRGFVFFSWHRRHIRFDVFKRERKRFLQQAAPAAAERVAYRLYFLFVIFRLHDVPLPFATFSMSWCLITMFSPEFSSNMFQLIFRFSFFPSRSFDARLTQHRIKDKYF